MFFGYSYINNKIYNNNTSYFFLYIFYIIPNLVNIIQNKNKLYFNSNKAIYSKINQIKKSWF